MGRTRRDSFSMNRIINLTREKTIHRSTSVALYTLLPYNGGSSFEELSPRSPPLGLLISCDLWTCVTILLCPVTEDCRFLLTNEGDKPGLVENSQAIHAVDVSTSPVLHSRCPVLAADRVRPSACATARHPHGPRLQRCHVHLGDACG